MKRQYLYDGYQLGDLRLPNRIVMAALTRARATNEVLTPTYLHREYYAQRATAGLIITESVWVSKQAVGFINIPGIYSKEQIAEWKQVTENVHQKGGRIFIQLVHSGSVSHSHYQDGELPFGPSAINPMEQVFTPSGFVATETPQEYSLQGIKDIIKQFKQAAFNAKEAGFDGIELHAQIFTLIPQFLSLATNQRTDEYGGSISNRCRLLFEILDTLTDIFPGQKVGIKFTPAAFNSGIIQPDENTISDFEYLFKELNNYDLAFVEVVGPRKSLAETIISAWNDDFFGWFRSRFHGTIVANLGFNAETGNTIIKEGKADLVSYGEPFIANPDLVARFQNAWPLAAADVATFYAGEEKGFTDYPVYG